MESAVLGSAKQTMTPELDKIYDRLNRLRSRVGTVSGTLSEGLDRILGPVPQEAESGALDHDGGKIYNIGVVLDQIENMVSGIETSVGRQQELG